MRPMLERLMGEDVGCAFGCRRSGDDLRRSESTPAGAHQPAVNSRDAMPDGGQVSIETGFVEWDESHANCVGGARGATSCWR